MTQLLSICQCDKRGWKDGMVGNAPKCLYERCQVYYYTGVESGLVLAEKREKLPKAFA